MPSLLVVAAAVFGAASGAFVPRLAHRLAVPFGSPSRSACAVCARPFPQGPTGFVRVGAACPCSPAAWRAAVIGSAVATALLAAALGATPMLPLLLLAAVNGVLLAAIDIRCLRLPDPLVATLAVVTVLPLALGGQTGRGVVAAGVVGLGYLLLALLPGGGVGLGDVKLAAVLAFVLGCIGWPAVLVGVIAPQLINGPVALALLVRRRAGRRTALPFGPALLAGALVAVVTTA